MEEHLASLNEKQREAVLQTEGPVLIVAGAGAGKTKTMTHRMLHLIKHGTPAQNILAITFTNKAAREMKERIGKLLGNGPADLAGEEATTDESREGARATTIRRPEPFVSTFHALGVYIMKQNAELLGLPRFFGIYDKTEGKRIIKEILISRGYDPKQVDPAKLLYIISAEKGKFVTAEQYLEKAGAGYTEKLVAMVWPEYEKKLREEKAVDLDDLLLVTAHLLAKNEKVRTYYQQLWKYIHVDEYQDTNGVQYEIVRHLAAQHRNLCVVGDTDQNIYSWRGADISNMLRFEKDYPEAKVILLEENYRSSATIIAAANGVIKKNKMRIEKNLFTRKADGEKIGVFEAWNEMQEAFFVTTKVRELKHKRVPLHEIAVLYRANFQSRILEEAFVAEGIAYSMIGTKFFERKEIKDVISFIRAAMNRQLAGDVRRVINVPPRGIGEKTLDKVESGQLADLSALARAKVEKFFELLDRIKIAAETKLPSEVVKYVMAESGMEDVLKRGNEQDLERLENVRELVTLAKRYDMLPMGEGIDMLIADAALAASEESAEEGAEAVKLMTVHAAKGLEFDYVFVTGMEQDLFPHHRANDGRMTASEAEEERRLFYVALTRARIKIFLSYATMRTVFGERRTTMPSEFLSDIEPGYTELEFLTDPENRPKPRKVIEF